MNTVSELFQQPDLVRDAARRLPETIRPQLAAVAAAAFSRQVPAGEQHEHVCASLHLLADSSIDRLADALGCEASDQALWHAWIALGCEARRDAAALIAAYAAHDLVSHTGDLDLVLEQVLPSLGVDGMAELAHAAHTLDQHAGALL